MTSTTAMKSSIMMNTSPDMDDPFADLPTATDDATATLPSLVSPLEFGTGIKYVVEHQQQSPPASPSGAVTHDDVKTTIQKDNDTTETTVDNDADDTPEAVQETPVEAE